MKTVRTMKKYLLFAAAFLFAVACGFYSAYAANITSQSKLGDYTHYNGFIFGQFKAAQADLEGALAIGGASELGTTGQYDVGAAYTHYSNIHIGTYTNPNGYPSLLLNGVPKIGKDNGESHVNIYGGPVVMNEDIEPAYLASKNKFSVSKGGVQYAEKDMINQYFADAFQSFNRTSETLPKANEAVLSLDDFDANRYGDLSQYENKYLKGTGLSIVSVNISSDGYATINEPSIPADFGNYDVIIFNFPNAVSARFTSSAMFAEGKMLNTSAPTGMSGNALVKKYAEKVIWNFPQARTIDSDGCGIVGSVLAPYAGFYASGGSLNGMLVADSFETADGMELHGFRLNGGILDVYVDGEVTVIKHDAGSVTKVLEGAEFELYRKSGGAWAKVSPHHP